MCCNDTETWLSRAVSAVFATAGHPLPSRARTMPNWGKATWECLSANLRVLYMKQTTAETERPASGVRGSASEVARLRVSGHHGRAGASVTPRRPTASPVPIRFCDVCCRWKGRGSEPFLPPRRRDHRHRTLEPCAAGLVQT
eukprot:2476240-Rhodomonas_salina.1